MLMLKNKLFDVLARNISIESFEQWLYNDRELLKSVESNSFVLEVIDRDFSSKHIYVDLEKLCFEHFDKEEYLVYALETTCKKILNESNVKNIVKYALFLDKYYSWEDDFKVIYAFYGVACNIDLVEMGHMSIFELQNDLKGLSEDVLLSLKDLSLDRKINILKKGI